MRFLLLSIAVLCSFVGISQNEKFERELAQIHGFYYPDIVSGEERLNKDAFDTDLACALIISTINNRIKKRLRPTLEQDSILNKICFAGIKTYSSKIFEKGKLYKEKPWIDKAIREQGSKNKMILTYAFEVDLVDYNPILRYHLNKKEGTSPIDLYAGSKRTRKDSSRILTPILMKTQIQFVDAVGEVLKSNGFEHYLFKRNFSAIGLAAELNEKSLKIGSRPRLKIILIVSGKQNQKIRERPNPLLEKADDIKAGKIKIEDSD